MMEDATNSEYLLAHKVAQDYRSRGYEVSRNVPLDFLPGFRADLIARKDGDTVVVEVKGRSALSANPKIRELATILETKPGWSFELLLVGEPERLDALEGARSFEYKGILDRLGEAEKALGVGLAEAAFVLAWSALEAAARELIAAQGVSNQQITTTSFVLDQAVSLGVIPREEYDNLTQMQKYRNAIVHGFSTEDLTHDLVNDLIDIIQRMIAKTG